MVGRITDSSYILGFLSGKTEDYKGREYLETLEWSDAELEECHDQIQHIFPLHEDSRMARTWPVVSKEIVEEGKKNAKVIANLKVAKDRFERFWGLNNHESHSKQDRWCRMMPSGRPNHNLLRITRVIRCLRLFGLEDEANEFYCCATEAANRCGVGGATLTYWKMALNDDVWETLQA